MRELPLPWDARLQARRENPAFPEAAQRRPVKWQEVIRLLPIQVNHQLNDVEPICSFRKQFGYFIKGCGKTRTVLPIPLKFQSSFLVIGFSHQRSLSYNLSEEEPYKNLSAAKPTSLVDASCLSVFLVAARSATQLQQLSVSAFFFFLLDGSS